MFLFCDTLTEDGKVVQMIENGNRNKDLWKNNTGMRDDGGITIGTCFSIFNPRLIEDYFAGDVPLRVKFFRDGIKNANRYATSANSRGNRARSDTELCFEES